jgi:hypothetical protein
MATMEYVNIKHVLTQEERNDMAFTLAEKQIEMNSLEDEKKSVTSSYKAKIDAKKAEINVLSGNIKDGYVFHSLYCEKRRNVKKKQWEWWDTQNGEMIKVEPFQGKDYQISTDDQIL